MADPGIPHSEMPGGTQAAPRAPGAPRPPGWHPALKWVPVWLRNFLFWRRLAAASAVTHLGEPTLYLLGLGYGLGALVGDVHGVPYLHFLAAGFICSSSMMTSTFEATYSAFSRMHVQQTWDAMLSAPLQVRDVVIGETVWAASKGGLSAAGVLLVASLVGALDGPRALWTLPIALLTGLCFAALGMLVTTIARSYDTFMFYMSLVITPMFLLSGVFFPLSQMPPPVQLAASALPLTHAVALIRPLATGQPLSDPWLHLAVLTGIAAAATWLAVHMATKRLQA